MSRVFKTICLLFIFLIQVNSLSPAKLPSGKPRSYKYNDENPEADLKQITAQEASFISRHWLNNILQPKKICKEDVVILENINALEGLIQEQFTEDMQVNIKYLAWTPKGITEDVLFLIVIQNYQNTSELKLLIHSPFWDSSQINTDCLLKSIHKYSLKHGNMLDINKFIDRNIRYKLIWHNFKLE